jgi:hypothetical protein
VTPINNFLRSQYETNNGFEWYFAAGRVSMDFRFCNDSSALGDESPLAITQNANVNIPVLGIGGSKGLTSAASSFDTYLDSIATAAADTHVCILDGYAHVDPIAAADNESAVLILDMVDAVENDTPISTALTCLGSPPPAPAP